MSIKEWPLGLFVSSLAIPGGYVYAQAATSSASTSSSIPVAGDAVKDSDVVIWGVNKVIKLTKPTDASKPNDSATGSAPSTTPTTVDTEKAASAIAAAAHRLVEMAPPPDATTEIRTQYAAAYEAAVQADNALQKAKASAFDSPHTVASPLGTNAATETVIASAVQDVKAKKSVAEEKMAASQIAKTAAAAASGKGAKPGDKEKTQAALLKADADAQDAKQKLAIAKAYYLAAVSALESLATAPPVNDDSVCFPVRSRFNVTNVVAATKTAGPATSAATNASNTQLVSGHFSSRGSYSILHWLHYRAIPGKIPNPNAPPTITGTTPCGSGEPANYDETYTFSADQLSQGDFYRQGFTWGGLVVPYKYYFVDRSIKSNTSALAYVGYEGWFPGVSLATIAGVGVGSTQSTVTTTQTGLNGKPTTATSNASLVTASIGVGWIATFGGTFKAGLLFGRDFQGNASAFPYEHKLWMGLSLGAGF